MKPSRLPLLITGCPRSGTLFTAKLLRHAGYDVHWEQFGPQGLVSWMGAAASLDVPFGGAPCSGVQFDRVLAIARDPLDVIGSIVHICLGDNSRDRFLAYARRFVVIPERLGVEVPEHELRLAQAVWFYCGWQRLVEARGPQDWFRIDVPADRARLLAAVADVLGPPGVCREKAAPATDTHHYGAYMPAAVHRIERVVPAWLVADLETYLARFGRREPPC